MAKYASGNQERLRLGFTNNNENDTSLRVVGRVGIGTTVFDASSSLDVRGDVSISGELTVAGTTLGEDTNTRNLNVSGVSTFAGAANFNSDLDVDGHTELDDLNVSGVSTFAGASDFNGDVDIDGHTELDDLNVSGVSTFVDNIDANGNLDVDGHTELDNLNVSGVSTFTGIIDANSGLDVTGVVTATAFHTGVEGSAIRITSNTISGPAEMFIDPAAVGNNTGSVRIKGDLFVDGAQTIINSSTIELADFIVGIASTATTDLLADGAGIEIGPDNTFKYHYNGGTNPSLKSSENLNIASGKAYQIDQTEVLNATTLGSGVVNSSLTSVGNLTSLTVDGRIVGAATSNVIPFLYAGLSDLPSASTYHGAFAHVHATGAAYYAHAGNWLELVNKDTNGNVVLSGNLDVDGQTDLDEVVVGGAATFSSTASFNNGFSVAGSSGIFFNGLSVAGTAVFNSPIDANGSLDVDGHTELDDVNISGILTASTLDVTGGGAGSQTNISNLNVSGVSTFTGAIDANGSLDVDGHTELDDVNVSGASTFTGAIDANGDLDVDGHTELDTLNVSGISTFEDGLEIGGPFSGTDGVVIKAPGTGSRQILKLFGGGATNGKVVIQGHGPNNNNLVANAGGATELWWAGNNTKRLETTGIGVSIYDNLNVGTGVTIYGNSGIVSATSFYGDGSNLLNTGATLSAAAGAQRLVLTSLTSGTMVDAATDADLTFNATTNTLDTSNLNVGNNLSVTGLSTFTDFAYFHSNIRVDGTLSANGYVGSDGQYLKSTGIGISWATFPTLRSTQTNTASAGQTTFNFSYNVNFLDVFVNGVKLTPSEYTATNGSQIILDTPAFAGEVIEFHSYNTTSYGGGGGGGGGASILNDLSDVSVGTLADDQLLQYNSATSQWINVSALSVVGAANLNNLSGVTISSVADDQLLQYNSANGQWENTSVATAIGTANLNDLSGVTISAVADDQLLQYNSSTSQWENISAATVVGAASSFATKSVTPTTATAGQTTFSGTYTVGFVDVYLNGVKLSEDQYTATTGTNIVLDEGASENDIVEVVGLTANVPGSGGGSSYANSNVDTHLNTSTASTGEVLSWNGSDYDWVAQSSGGGGGASRNSETLTIGSIASGVTTTGTITLPKTGVMISIHPVGDASGWLRLYTRSDLWLQMHQEQEHRIQILVLESFLKP